jgi:hypothetical protein
MRTEIELIRRLLEPQVLEGRVQVDIDLPDRILIRTNKLVGLVRSYNEEVTGYSVSHPTADDPLGAPRRSHRRSRHSWVCEAGGRGRARR